MPKKEIQPKKSSGSAGKNNKKAGKEPEREEQEAYAPKPRRVKAPGDPEGIRTQIVTALFWVMALLTAVFFIANLWEDPGPLVKVWCTVLYGLFGYGGLLSVCFFILIAIEWKRCVLKRNALYKTLFALLFMVFVSALIHVIMIMSGGVDTPTWSTGFRFWDYWYLDGHVVGGGAIGGLLGAVLYLLVHGWIAILTCVIFLAATLMFYFEVTPAKLVAMIGAYWAGRGERAENRAKARADARDIKEAKAAAREAEAEEKRLLLEKRAAELAARRKAEEDAAREEAAAAKEAAKRAAEEEAAKARERHRDPGIDFDFMADKEEASPAPAKASKAKESEPFVGMPFPEPEEAPVPPAEPEEIFDFEHIPVEEKKSGEDWNDTDFGFGNEEEPDLSRFFPDPVVQEEAEPAPSPEDELPFDDPDELPADPAADLTAAAAAPEKPKYVFPPTSLLTRDDSPKTGEDREELMRNARKLVEVLKSFRVETDIVNISQGPTITRYELAPKIGVRVRAIANLVDDIALNLETSGVRIEAPIPGKAAVGVEVPNRSQSTVYLRELIESEAFRSAKSKLTACLGVDVSGAPLLMDIAKMPHLLIAGATGMGKSVSVNSIIMSLLYKATPDELKLILVDPKKVELNVYNKLPHLLIPVVNNPKKAAGALATAVNEMERRFELIESVGVRDIKGYNKLTETDPTKEFLPQIVIIIDELADLMMTAKDDVEDSICRIAQKARAAGIHLIICTQRPSVDVITGLIKANVPSRIAFTVASNVDSRTIIDISGAEKLIGRGDMLFAPVGAMKPIRAQGAFVSDNEVEAVTDFIKNQAADVQYDDSFLNQVEIEAERCGQQKKKVTGEEIDGDEETDPKFYEAVEVALDMGKISTSLLQRRLSLGYGRAAKIVDKMEQLGIVGPPEGQKPRNILISRKDFQEMIMRRDDSGEE